MTDTKIKRANLVGFTTSRVRGSVRQSASAASMNFGSYVRAMRDKKASLEASVLEVARHYNFETTEIFQFIKARHPDARVDAVDVNKSSITVDRQTVPPTFSVIIFVGVRYTDSHKLDVTTDFICKLLGHFIQPEQAMVMEVRANPPLEFSGAWRLHKQNKVETSTDQ
jgi:hypothetical protein